ncbi:MAG TPA: histidine phosphatase family protein [Bacteroidia bacterium]
MRTLYLVRHAKASRDGNFKDWERPLLEVGIQRANKVSKVLKRKNICPDKIISSHAFRALNTAVIFSANMKCRQELIEISNDVYGKDGWHLLQLIKKQSDGIHSLMLVGHEPYLSGLFEVLTGKLFPDTFSTSAVVCIRINRKSWKDAGEKSGGVIFIEKGK